MLQKTYQPNLYLRSLSEDDYRVLVKHIETVRMEIGPIDSYDEQGRTRFVYFPMSAVCSLDALAKDGEYLQIALFGSDVVAGNFLPCNPFQPMMRTQVIIPGAALRAPSSVMAQLYADSPAFAEAVLKVSLQFLRKTTIEVMCSNRCAPRKRIADRLRTLHALVGDTQCEVSACDIADWLGLARSTVHAHLGLLRDEGAIAIGNGTLMVCNVSQVRAYACGCADTDGIFGPQELLDD